VKEGKDCPIFPGMGHRGGHKIFFSSSSFSLSKSKGVVIVAAVIVPDTSGYKTHIFCATLT
jgi:hypothetical protein